MPDMRVSPPAATPAGIRSVPELRVIADVESHSADETILHPLPLGNYHTFGGPNDAGGYYHATQVVAVVPALPILMPGLGNEEHAPRIDPVVAAAIQGPPTGRFEPQIDPALLSTSAQLPTPRQSVTPAPAQDIALRPRPKPRGKAATDDIIAQRERIPLPHTPVTEGDSLRRKRTINADALAAEEALRIGSASGKRQRRPAARKLGL